MAWSEVIDNPTRDTRVLGASWTAQKLGALLSGAGLRRVSVKEVAFGWVVAACGWK